MAHTVDTTDTIVSEEIIAQIVQKIVDQVDPLQVILFGSYAIGDPTPDSDLDLFVVMESDFPRHKRSAKIRLLFSPAPCPIDILVYTPQEVESWSGVVNHIVTNVMATGKTLYERSSDHVRSPVA
ncbi:MAG: nucleotidyltransferase domain-containing protein [Candidatus Latescibacteria bacterium]|nr:nucleotidyltransferase domain-containing protein [Candidatus Latescibacterota bacterium]